MTEVDLRAVVRDDVDPLIPWGRELRDSATAVVEDGDIDAARDRLAQAANPAAAEPTAGVVGCFEMMNRALDATGCLPPQRHLPVADVLGVTVPR